MIIYFNKGRIFYIKTNQKALIWIKWFNSGDKFSKKLIGLVNINSTTYEAFKSSIVNEKSELLNFIFANLELKGRKLCYTLAFPFSEFEKVKIVSCGGEYGTHCEP